MKAPPPLLLRMKTFFYELSPLFRVILLLPAPELLFSVSTWGCTRVFLFHLSCSFVAISEVEFLGK